MANVFQASTGYRDPQRAMTIKALEARAKAAAEATAQAIQPQTIAAPSQGWAQMVGALGANIQQGRAESAAAEGRDALAQAMAGVNMDTGPSMQDIAIIGQHDPELAQRMYEQAMKTRQENLNREDTQEFTAGESLLERQQREKLEADRNALTQSESALQRKSSEGIATAGNISSEKIATDNNVSQEGIADLNRKSTEGINTADNEAAAARDKAQQDAAAALEQYKQGADPDSPIGKIVNDFRQGVYNIPGEDQNHPNTKKRFEDAIAGENKKGTPAVAGSEYTITGEREASKRHGEILTAGHNAGEFKANILRLKDLGTAAGTGKLKPLLTQLGGWARAIGIDAIEGVPEAEAYQSIIDKMAPQMRAPGSGSSSDTDVRMFLNSLPSLSNTPEGNALITQTFEAISNAKLKAAAIIQEGQLKNLPWYEIDKQIDAIGDPFEAFRAAHPNGADPATPNAADPFNLLGGGGTSGPAPAAAPAAPAAPAAANPNDPFNLLGNRRPAP